MEVSEDLLKISLRHQMGSSLVIKSQISKGSSSWTGYSMLIGVKIVSISTANTTVSENGRQGLSLQAILRIFSCKRRSLNPLTAIQELAQLWYCSEIPSALTLCKYFSIYFLSWNCESDSFFRQSVEMSAMFSFVSSSSMSNLNSLSLLDLSKTSTI